VGKESQRLTTVERKGAMSMDLDDGWGGVIFITIVEGYQGSRIE